MLAACVSPTSAIPHGLRAAQCHRGTLLSDGPKRGGVTKGVWDSFEVFQWFSIVGYAVHGAMAWKVRSVARGMRDRGEVEAVDPDEEEAKRVRARELWNKQYRMEGL